MSVQETKKNKETEVLIEKEDVLTVKKEVRDLEIEKLNEVLSVEKQLKDMEEFIRTNEGTFVYDKKNYKVIRPTLAIQKEVERYKIIKKVELLKDDKLMFESELRKLFKSRGIDIEGMEQEMLNLTFEIEEIGESALKATGKSQDKLINRVKVKKEKFAKLSLEKNSFLEGCIEQVLLNEGNIYTTYMSLQEKNEKEEWVKMFDTYESFNKYKDNRLLLSAYNILNSLLWSYEAE